MISKKNIDLFILREAFNVLKEDLSQDLQDIEERYSQQEEQYQEEIENLTTKIAISKAQKLAASNSTNAPNITSAQKNYFTSNFKQHDINIKTYNEMKKKLEDKISEMKKEKSEEIKRAQEIDSKQKSEINTSMNISENLKINQPNPVKKVQPNADLNQNVEKKQKTKDLIVRFDTNTTTPFTVKFTKRGFVVGNTRMSFELIEQAINKRFSVTLKNGLILTPVKMQKILKYKNRV